MKNLKYWTTTQEASEYYIWKNYAFFLPESFYPTVPLVAHLKLMRQILEHNKIISWTNAFLLLRCPASPPGTRELELLSYLHPWTTSMFPLFYITARIHNRIRICNTSYEPAFYTVIILIREFCSLQNDPNNNGQYHQVSLAKLRNYFSILGCFHQCCRTVPFCLGSGSQIFFSQFRFQFRFQLRFRFRFQFLPLNFKLFLQ
jgi:hypothetical protein